MTQPSSVAASGAIPGEAGKPVGSMAGNLSITVSRVSMVVPCLAETAPSMVAENTTRPRSCSRTKASRQAGLSGAKLAPQARRDMAERRVHHATVDIGHRRERRVHQHDTRNETQVEVIVDLSRVEADGGDVRKQSAEYPARVSARLRMSDPPASSARMASRPVPA